MTIKDMTEVMQAYEEGKKIQFTRKNEDDWSDIVGEPTWNWNHYRYRIKTEPKYVPYDSVSEVDRDKWVKDKTDGILSRIVGLDPIDNAVQFYGWCSLKELFERYTYEDGSPCGKKVEE